MLALDSHNLFDPMYSLHIYPLLSNILDVYKGT